MISPPVCFTQPKIIDQIFTPLYFRRMTQNSMKESKAVYCLQVSVLLLEIFKFKKWVKYANEMTDDIIHSTQYYLEYINKVILANLQHRPLKLGRLMVQ